MIKLYNNSTQRLQRLAVLQWLIYSDRFLSHEYVNYYNENRFLPPVLILEELVHSSKVHSRKYQ
jgi:hypothetical protein